MQTTTVKPEEISLKQVHVVPHSTQTAGPMGRHEQSSGANSGQQLLAGQVATFECVTHGSRPQATIHWIFQGQKYEPPIDGKYSLFCHSNPCFSGTTTGLRLWFLFCACLTQARSDLMVISNQKVQLYAQYQQSII